MKIEEMEKKLTELVKGAMELRDACLASEDAGNERVEAILEQAMNMVDSEP